MGNSAITLLQNFMSYLHSLFSIGMISILYPPSFIAYRNLSKELKLAHRNIVTAIEQSSGVFKTVLNSCTKD